MSPEPGNKKQGLDATAPFLLKARPTAAFRISFLNLQKHLPGFAADWPAKRDWLHAQATEIFNAALGPDDRCGPAGDDMLVLYATKSVDSAQSAVREKIAAFEERVAEAEDPFLLGLSCSLREVHIDEAMLRLNVEVPQNRTAANKPEGCVLSPVWSSQKSIVMGALCVPELYARGGKDEQSKDYFSEKASGHEVDLASVDHALSLAFLSARKGDPRRIFFSVNYNNLKSTTVRAEYERYVRQTPARLSPLLVPRVVRIPYGTPPTTIHDLTAFLRAVFRHFAVEASISTTYRKIQLHEEVGQTVTCLSAYAVEQLGGYFGGTEAFVDQFVSRARTCLSRSMVHDVTDRELFDASVKAGADFVSGQIISPTSKELAFPNSISREKILSSFNASVGAR